MLREVRSVLRLSLVPRLMLQAAVQLPIGYHCGSLSLCSSRETA